MKKQVQQNQNDPQKKEVFLRTTRQEVVENHECPHTEEIWHI